MGIIAGGLWITSIWIWMWMLQMALLEEYLIAMNLSSGWKKWSNQKWKLQPVHCITECITHLNFGHHQPEPHQQYETPDGVQYPPPLQGELKIYCEANPDFSLAGRNGSVVMVSANESYPSQQWIMDISWSVKSWKPRMMQDFLHLPLQTKLLARHWGGMDVQRDKVTLGPYHPDDLNEAVLLT